LRPQVAATATARRRWRSGMRAHPGGGDRSAPATVP
jgi:hypothetical protein